MIKTADELVKHGEKAFVVFTRDLHFEYDHNGKGFTGYWVVKSNTIERIDKVLIYVKNPVNGNNEIYLGRYSHWTDSPEEGRKNIHFTNLEFKGLSNSTWFEFGGSAWSPTFYIPKVNHWYENPS